MHCLSEMMIRVSGERRGNNEEDILLDTAETTVLCLTYSSVESRASQSTFAAERQEHPDELGRVA